MCKSAVHVRPRGEVQGKAQAQTQAQTQAVCTLYPSVDALAFQWFSTSGALGFQRYGAPKRSPSGLSLSLQITKLGTLEVWCVV